MGKWWASLGGVARPALLLATGAWPLGCGADAVDEPPHRLATGGGAGDTVGCPSVMGNSEGKPCMHEDGYRCMAGHVDCCTTFRSGYPVNYECQSGKWHNVTIGQCQCGTGGAGQAGRGGAGRGGTAAGDENGGGAPRGGEAGESAHGGEAGAAGHAGEGGESGSLPAGGQSGGTG